MTTTIHATTIRHASALCLAGLTALIALPLRAADAPAPAEPTASTDQHFTCPVAYKAGDPQCGKEACVINFAGSFPDLPTAQKRCVEYAANHGGVCSTAECKVTEAATATKQKFYCSGNVRCEQEKDSSKERFCGYDRQMFEAKDATDAERKARNKWIPDCRERDDSAKWQCKMRKGPTCDVGEK